MSRHPNRFEISLPSCHPPSPPLVSSPSRRSIPIVEHAYRGVCVWTARPWTDKRTRVWGGRGACMWDSARMMLNAQKCNCIVERKNPPRDVDGTIMGPIIILSTPQGQAFLSPYSPCHPTCLPAYVSLWFTLLSLSLSHPISNCARVHAWCACMYLVRFPPSSFLFFSRCLRPGSRLLYPHTPY